MLSWGIIRSRHSESKELHYCSFGVCVFVFCQYFETLKFFFCVGVNNCINPKIRLDRIFYSLIGQAFFGGIVYGTSFMRQATSQASWMVSTAVYICLLFSWSVLWWTQSEWNKSLKLMPYIIQGFFSSVLLHGELAK